MKDIRKVIIPVAGWGTRSLPATKNIPKEMLPIYNKPVIQYVVEEAIRAKIRDVIFVTNRDKSVIEDHFDYNLQLEGVLERAGKLDKLQTIRDVAEMVNIMSVRQKKQLGLGHAIMCARELVRDDPFAIMVGDDLMFGGVPGIGQLIDVALSEKMPVVGVMEVPWEKVSKYGIIDGEEVAPGVFRVKDMVEKPKREDAPSRLAIVGRYVLTPDILISSHGGAWPGRRNPADRRHADAGQGSRNDGRAHGRNAFRRWRLGRISYRKYLLCPAG